ncbi:rod shape-determining protein MreC [bacterium]|nr:rod shape-determining protein MreC [bacterium]
MERKTRRLLLGSLAIGSIVLFGVVFRGSVARAFAAVERPLVAAGTWIGGKAVGIFDAAAVSPERVARLEAERDSALIDKAELDRLRDENQELRDALGFVARQSLRSVLASVVSRSIGPEASSVVIDRGSDDGIVVGAPVVSGAGIMIGKVTSVTRGSATVRALSDHASATAVTLYNESRTIGVAEGLSGSLLSLQYVPQDEKISVNDIVVTSGLEQNVPSGLLVGIVNQVNSDPIAPFQTAVLEPLSDVRRVASVAVLVPNVL